MANPDAAHATSVLVSCRFDSRKAQSALGNRQGNSGNRRIAFGLFMEIEASEREIKRVESFWQRKIAAGNGNYPRLTISLGNSGRGFLRGSSPQPDRQGGQGNWSLTQPMIHSLIIAFPTSTDRKTRTFRPRSMAAGTKAAFWRRACWNPPTCVDHAAPAPHQRLMLNR